MNTMLTTLPTWHQVAKSRDVKALRALIAEDAVFHSPVVHTPQRGKQLTVAYLSAAFQVFFNDSFRYVREVVTGNDAVLEFEVEIDGVAVNGVDMIRCNDEGLITEFKVMIRPLKAINLIHQKMGEMLQRQQQAPK
jgi:hypothetical protein